MEIQEILLFHAARYPLMTPQDAVKLLYQNAFGPGHLLSDPLKAMIYLEREHVTLPPAAPLPPEPIGNGLVRVYLNGLSLPNLAKLFHDFSETAANFRGDAALFAQNLSRLEALTAEGAMPFDVATLSAYLIPYRRADCPLVSHSSQYKAAYAPAYRVVQEDLPWGEPAIQPKAL